MNPVPQPVVDVISPAEARFWQEWAAKAPALLRKEVVGGMYKEVAPKLQMDAVIGVGVGVTLGVASFTKYVPGKWKLVTGAGALGAGLWGMVSSVASFRIKEMKQAFTILAELLDKTPALQNEFSEYLSKTVTAEDMQKFGIEHTVIMKAADFGHTIQLARAESLVNQVLQNHQETLAAHR